MKTMLALLLLITACGNADPQPQVINGPAHDCPPQGYVYELPTSTFCGLTILTKNKQAYVLDFDSGSMTPIPDGRQTIGTCRLEINEGVPSNWGW